MSTPDPENPPAPAPENPPTPTPPPEEDPDLKAGIREIRRQIGEILAYGPILDRIDKALAPMGPAPPNPTPLVDTSGAASTTSTPAPQTVASTAPQGPPKDGDILTVEGKRVMFRERREGSGWKSEFVPLEDVAATQ